MDGFRHRVGKKGNSIENLLLKPILTLIWVGLVWKVYLCNSSYIFIMLVWFLSTMRFMRIIIITTKYKLKRVYLTLCEAFQSKGSLSSTEHIFKFTIVVMFQYWYEKNNNNEC